MSLLYWYNLSFGRIGRRRLDQVVCAASFLIAVGFQLVYSSFSFICSTRRDVSSPEP